MQGEATDLSAYRTDRKLDWIALSLASGIGARTAGVLIDRFGSPGAVLDALPRELEIAGLKSEVIDDFNAGELRQKAEDQLQRLEKLGATILTLEDADYPALLRETYDPPIVLYVRGDFQGALAQPCIAVVGSRRCSTYGRNAAERLSRDLAAHCLTIVSGLARGIDTAAHTGALEGGGKTVAVMGTGLDDIYPKENRQLAEKICENGALLTEFPLGTPPVSQNFPFRNRVISGISLGVMVVEAAERSGSLITARLSYEQGREVFAVPGNITSSKSFGPNYLIKDGAKLVQIWQDVVEELPRDIKEKILSRQLSAEAEEKQLEFEIVLSPEEQQLLHLLSFDEPVHIDNLLVKSGLGPPSLMGALLSLEMKDKIRQLPGKSFVRKM